MLQTLGFGTISTDALWAVCLCLLVLALVVGWVSDSILGQVGFGLFGNSFFGLAGAFVGLVVFVRYGWEWIHPDIVTMTGASVLGAFAGVLAMAVFRRMTV